MKKFEAFGQTFTTDQAMDILMDDSTDWDEVEGTPWEWEQMEQDGLIPYSNRELLDHMAGLYGLEVDPQDPYPTLWELDRLTAHERFGSMVF